MSAKNVVFVDHSVENYPALLGNLMPDSIVIELNAEEDGVLQMARALAGIRELDSIHIVSHGSAGALYLGTGVLNADSLSQYQSALQQMGQALSVSGDLLLYGCNVAAGESGQAFVATLAEVIGVEVAASVDVTGAAAQGGDGQLEFTTGEIEAEVMSMAGLTWNLSVNTVPSFGIGSGIVTTDIGLSTSQGYSVTDDCGYSMVVQADGKILVAGSSGSDFALVRYNADGSLDSSFDGDGKVTTDFAESYDTGQSVTVQADGKILVAGYSGNGQYYDFALVRYNADGSLDSSFGGDGKLTTTNGTYGPSCYAKSVTVQSDGKILMAGYDHYQHYDNSYSDFVLVRYNANGSLDSSFSADGKLTTDLAGSDIGQSVIVQTDGKILLAGYSFISSTYDFALVRYNVDGSLDSSFGKLTTDLAGSDVGQSVIVQTDGKILLAGYSNNDFALVRYNVDGSLDSSFSADGKLTTDLAGSDVGQSVIVQTDGKILLAGYSNNDFALVRYNADGSLDSSFSGDGKLTTAVRLNNYDAGHSVVLQSDSKILVAGSSGGDFALVSYLLSGDLDKYFGTSTLDATATQTSTTPVLLDSNVEIYDSELTLLNNYYGSTLTLSRHSGPQAEDVFSGTGILSALTQNGYFSLNGVSIGRVLTNSNGTLKLGFTAGVTQEQVSAAMQNIAYVNSATIPPVQVQIDWLFSDGNTGTQGSGGALSVTGHSLVNITARNVAPTLLNPLPDVSIQPDRSFHFALPDFTFADANANEPFSYAISMADGSAMLPWLSFDGVGGVLSGQPGIFDFGSYNIKVTATDLAGASVFDTFQLTISDNEPPSGLVSIAGTATQGQTLTVSHTLADLDGLGAVSYQWLANGAAIAGATGNSLVLDQAQVGKAIGVKASYTDALGTPENVYSNTTAHVTNVNDEVSGEVVLSGSAQQGQTLTVSQGLHDVDGLGTLTYQWWADGQPLNEPTSGTSATTWVLQQAQVGKSMQVVVGYTDALGTAESVASEATVAVLNLNDAPVGNVTISGTVTQGQILTASAVLSDVDGLGTLAYQWLAAGENMVGATTSSLTLTQAQVGKTISVKVSYNDAAGTAESVNSLATGVVANINDTPVGSVSISGTASQGQTLTANNSLSDADGLGTLTYQWLADNGVITGASSATLLLTQAQVGKAISVKARYTDSAGTPESVSSSASALVANVNDAPLGNVTIAGSATQGQTLTASHTLSDADQLGVISYQWLSDGQALLAATQRFRA